MLIQGEQEMRGQIFRAGLGRRRTRPLQRYPSSTRSSAANSDTTGSAVFVGHRPAPHPARSQLSRRSCRIRHRCARVARRGSGRAPTVTLCVVPEVTEHLCSVFRAALIPESDDYLPMSWLEVIHSPMAVVVRIRRPVVPSVKRVRLML